MKPAPPVTRTLRMNSMGVVSGADCRLQANSVTRKNSSILSLVLDLGPIGFEVEFEAVVGVVALEARFGRGDGLHRCPQIGLFAIAGRLVAVFRGDLARP